MMKATHEHVIQHIDTLAVKQDDSMMVRDCINLMKKYRGTNLEKDVIPCQLSKSKLYEDRCKTLSELVEHVRWARAHQSDEKLLAYLTEKAIAYLRPKEANKEDKIAMGKFIWWSNLYVEIDRIRKLVKPRPSVDGLTDDARIGALLIENAVLKGEKRVLQAEKASLQARNKVLESEVNALKATVHSLEAKDTDKTLKIDELYRRLSASELTVEQLQREHSQQMAMIMKRLGMQETSEKNCDSPGPSKADDIEMTSTLGNKNQTVYTGS